MPRLPFILRTPMVHFSAESARLDLLQQLRHRFGFDSFRHGQREVMEAVLLGRDVLAVMPTGQGKSLCFQLPATLTPGLTMVVVPADRVNERSGGCASRARYRGIGLSFRPVAAGTGSDHSGHASGKTPAVVFGPRADAARVVCAQFATGRALLACRRRGALHFTLGTRFRPDYLRLGELRRQTGFAALPCLDGNGHGPACSRTFETSWNFASPSRSSPVFGGRIFNSPYGSAPPRAKRCT